MVEAVLPTGSVTTLPTCVAICDGLGVPPPPKMFPLLSSKVAATAAAPLIGSGMATGGPFPPPKIPPLPLPRFGVEEPVFNSSRWSGVSSGASTYEPPTTFVVGVGVDGGVFTILNNPG